MLGFRGALFFLGQTCELTKRARAHVHVSCAYAKKTSNISHAAMSTYLLPCTQIYLVLYAVSANGIITADHSCVDAINGGPAFLDVSREEGWLSCSTVFELVGYFSPKPVAGLASRSRCH